MLLLFTLVPVVELAILFRLAGWIDWGPTIGLVIVTGILGAWLARREGIKTMASIQKDLAAGVMPTESLIDGALILVAGAVLVTPGVLTDALGFALLIPPIRGWFKRRVGRAHKHRITVIHYGPEDPFIDVESSSHDVEDSLLEDETDSPR